MPKHSIVMLRVEGARAGPSGANAEVKTDDLGATAAAAAATYVPAPKPNIVYVLSDNL